MKNICFFCGDISESGGTEKIMSLIANGLLEKNLYNIFILSRTQSKETNFYEFQSDLKIQRLKENNKIGKINAIKDIYKIRRFVKKNKIDVMIDVDLILDIYTIPALFLLKTKIISWEHFNYEIENTDLRRRIAMRLSSKFSDCIVTLTQYDSRDYQKHFKKLKNIEWIPNPINDYNYPKCDTKNKQIITVGKFLPIKGYDLLILIAKEVLTMHRDWKWVLLGDGPEKYKIEELAREYEIDKQLIFMGNVKNVKDYYEKSSIFVLPSKNEGFGLVVLEAKLCNLPVICFDIKHGIDDLVFDGINGFKISKFNIKDFANKVNELIENDDLREKLSNSSDIDFKRYNIDTIIMQWVNLLERICNNEE